MECFKRVDEFSAATGDRVRVEGLVCSVGGKSVEALDAFVNQVGTQLVERFCLRLEKSCYGSQLLCSFTLRHIPGVGATSDEVQALVSNDGCSQFLVIQNFQRLRRQNRPLLPQSGLMVISRLVSVDIVAFTLLNFFLLVL